ncbi:MAG: hypothetical protein LBV68_02105 [Spirochaetaceae bacterium]|jgi:hypothetical protein|nr:hypothetical protein [Spirochaetaceae bacterium]
MDKTAFKINILEKLEDEAIFLKGTSKSNVESSQKAMLNRKGNLLFNSGDIEGSRRIFITTGYSDGLSRVGDYYRSKKRLVDALRMYYLAHDKQKSDEICMELALFIKGLLKEDNVKTGRGG